MWVSCECQCECGMMLLLKSGASMTDAVSNDDADEGWC